MRRNSIAILIALLALGALMMYADEAVLIDFNLLKADIRPDAANQNKPTENRATMMDFSGTAGASYTPDQKKQMSVSLAIPNWDVVLASSSRNSVTTTNSMTKEATRADGKTVLGVHIRFPVADYNSFAKVQPPFEIPAFEPPADIDDQGNIKAKEQAKGGVTRFEGTKDDNTKITTALGIVKNVGVIKSLSVTVKGLNFPHGLYVVLKDADGAERSMFMGYLNFDGWKELRWDNPAYVTDVRNRELRIYPLYPKTVPMVKLDGFIFTRDAANSGGDFVTYIKDVKLLYDKAVLEPVQDIDDESLWGIVKNKEEARKIAESKRFGNQQVMRYLEKLKQENKTEFTASK